MKVFLGLAAGFLTLALFLQWLRLPIIHQGIWMSPDETANVLSAINYAERGSFNLPLDLIKTHPWAFPRSFVPLVAAGQIVPVGFLGMPLVLALMYKLVGLIGLLFFTPFFALLTLWALWKSLPKEWFKSVRFLVLLVWMSFPTVVIYANRGAFANLPIVCLAVWIWWLMVEVKGSWRWPFAGAALGLACILRPPEVIWLLPVTVLAFFYRRAGGQVDHPCALKIKSKEILFFVLPLALVVLGGAYVGFKTYGHWLTSGYQIRPNLSSTALVSSTAMQVKIGETAPLFQSLPFALHPRSILWNFYHYFIFLWPWALLIILAVYYAMVGRVWKKPEKWVVAAFVWTGLWLILFYGNGLYQDHVGFNIVSLGNSYLRYLLPLSVIVAVSAGLIMQKLSKHWSTRFLAVCLGIFLVSMGLWNALIRDDEGVVANERELARYADIRDQTRVRLAPGTIVLSDRSDKIFFPFFPAVSPLPDYDRIQTLVQDKIGVAAFLPILDAISSSAWQAHGLNLDLLFINNNQGLYYIYATTP